MKYQIYLQGKKLKDCAIQALAELIRTGRLEIRGQAGFLVARWLTSQHFVIQREITPSNGWRVEYEYFVTDAGRQYLQAVTGFTMDPEYLVGLA